MRGFSYSIIIAALILAGCSSGSNNSGSDPAQTTINNDGDFAVEVSNLQGEKLYTAVGELDLGPTTELVHEVSKQVVVKNTSTDLVNLAISVDSSVAGFSIKINRCPLKLAAGASCTVTVAFSNRGQYDNLLVQNTLSVNDLMVVLKSSVSGQPDPAVGAPDLEFTLVGGGYSPIGNDPRRILKIQNNGVGTAKNVSFTVPDGYVVAINRCSTNLRPHASCYVELFFPNWRGHSVGDEGVLSITSTNGAAVGYDILTGQLAHPPVISQNLHCAGVESDNYDFATGQGDLTYPTPSYSLDQGVWGYGQLYSQAYQKTTPSLSDLMIMNVGPEVAKVSAAVIPRPANFDPSDYTNHFCNNVTFGPKFAADGELASVPLSFPGDGDYLVCLKFYDSSNDYKVCPSTDIDLAVNARIEVSVDSAFPNLLSAKIHSDDSFYVTDEPSGILNSSLFELFDLKVKTTEYNHSADVASIPTAGTFVIEHKIVEHGIDPSDSAEPWIPDPTLSTFYYSPQIALKDKNKVYDDYIHVIKNFQPDGSGGPKYTSQPVLSGTYQLDYAFNNFIDSPNASDSVCVNMQNTNKVRCVSNAGDLFMSLRSTDGSFLADNFISIAFAKTNTEKEYCFVDQGSVTVSCIQASLGSLYTVKRTVTFPEAVNPISLSNINRNLSSGYKSYSIASLSGHVYTWGSQVSGVTGDYVVSQVMRDDNGLPLEGVSKLHSDNNHTCAVSSSNLYCWDQEAVGSQGHSLGQWGNANGSGENVDRLGSLNAKRVNYDYTHTPAYAPFDLGIYNYAMTDTSTCLVAQNNHVFCFGENAYLSVDQTMESGAAFDRYGAFPATAANGSPLTAGKIWSVHSGYCVDSGTNGVKCWGKFTGANIKQATDIKTPAGVAIDIDYTSGVYGIPTAGSPGRAFAKSTDGKVWTWSSANNAEYVKTEGGVIVSSVDSVHNFCALLVQNNNRGMYCWDVNGVAYLK